MSECVGMSASGMRMTRAISSSCVCSGVHPRLDMHVRQAVLQHQQTLVRIS
jgi:hypothetical protein